MLSCMAVVDVAIAVADHACFTRIEPPLSFDKRRRISQQRSLLDPAVECP